MTRFLLIICYLLMGSISFEIFSSEITTVKETNMMIVTGKVLDVDAGSMAFDGNGILTIASDTGKTILVYIPTGQSQPEASGLDLFLKLQKGDFVEISGRHIKENEMVIHSDTHYLKRLNQ